jgi:hypothetical protein
MLRKRMVGNKIQATFPAQALPWSGSTGIISATKLDPSTSLRSTPGNLKKSLWPKRRQR